MGGCPGISTSLAKYPPRSPRTIYYNDLEHVDIDITTKGRLYNDTIVLNHVITISEIKIPMSLTIICSTITELVDFSL